MKKLVPISLALLFVFNLAGYYIAYPVMSWCIKSTVRAGMEAGVFEKKLVLVKIPRVLTTRANEEFQMTDENEFQYKGKMYDVSRSETVGDSVFYYCYADYDEDQLIVNLDDHVKSDSGINAPDHKTGNHNLANNPLKEYIKAGHSRPDIVLSGNFNYGGFVSWHIISLMPDIQVPPPKVVV